MKTVDQRCGSHRAKQAAVGTLTFLVERLKRRRVQARISLVIRTEKRERSFSRTPGLRVAL